jgi:dihydroneopterin aldolase
MTAMLASVAGPGEAEIAIAGDADIVDMKDPAAGALGALPIPRIAETVRAIAGRRATSAVAGNLAMEPDSVRTAVEAVAATGVGYIKVGLPTAPGRDAVVRALAGPAAATRLVAVIFADREPDRVELIPQIAGSGFAGVMLDTADKSAHRLLTHVDIAGLSGFVRTARAHGLLVGLAGGLEEPDVPRLLALDPDFLGFRGALCDARDRRKGIDLGAVKAVRRLIPRDQSADAGANVDYRLLAARGWHPETAERALTQRIYVRDFVLPVRIGAYSHEKSAPQNVRFDVTVEVDRPRGEPQGMGQVFSYDLITDRIQSLVAEGHIDFVETLAERIAAGILREPRARRATVKVEKLDMGPGGVGVEIVMDRPEHGASANPLLAMLEESGRKPRA